MDPEKIAVDAVSAHFTRIDRMGLLHSYAAHPQKDFDWEPVFSVAPRTKAPVVREHYDEEMGEVQRTVEFARWGFKPAWAKEMGPRPIKARFETAHTNGMFRAGFASSRAVVPMTGYFEWVEMDDGTTPMLPSVKTASPSVLTWLMPRIAWIASLSRFRAEAASSSRAKPCRWERSGCRPGRRSPEFEVESKAVPASGVVRREDQPALGGNGLILMARE